MVLPEPGARPDPPRDLTATPAAGRLRLAWADGLPGGPVPRGAVGYEVRLGERTRLTAAPVTEFDGLPDGVAIPASVRSVDAFGRRSDPIGLPGVVHESWRDGLTGALEEFPDGTRADWHLSGHPGCVDVGTRAPGERGLPVDLGCGADEAVFSTRAPMTLNGGTGRFTVLTDAAGPGGTLTIDLAPGRADRIGTRDPASVPPPVLRVVADDAGVRIGTAPPGPARTAPGGGGRPPVRGPAVPTGGGGRAGRPHGRHVTDPGPVDAGVPAGGGARTGRQAQPGPRHRHRPHRPRSPPRTRSRSSPPPGGSWARRSRHRAAASPAPR
ncbi:hypothetical protein [Actinokineospora spheciospongiae]|uniref:hypothetical protein n=1 Tax=Actinokineospora spheciospongiae TaxID=909613 RepID=UPI000D872364|nr:hypothetical protein [Actinokineospora spheciospongiae]PWW50235.1 hypothetical protein DFQ13_12410 [Actinokineospora spheciospongiae]